MNKIYIPNYHAKSIYDIKPETFLSLGKKIIFLDLDNTLDSYRQKTPSEKAKNLINKLKEYGIEVIIVSNNTGKRVKLYAEELNIKYIPHIGKPFKKNILKNIETLNLNKDEIIMIGDQTVTDIAASNCAGLTCVLTDKIVKEDQFSTHFNRIFDRIIRKKLAKKHLLKEIY